jgi:transposase
MANGRRKEIIRHLTEEELTEELREADDPKIVRRLSFVKNLYRGDTLEEAADRVGKSQPTGVRWAERWNEGGLEALEPDYGDGRPPKLDEDEQEQLKELLEEGQPWRTQEILHLIEEEFDVSYHPNYIHELLRSFDMNYAKPRPKRPERPDDADEILEERIEEAVEDDEEDEEPVTDGGYVVGFSTRRGHSQPTTANESGRSTSPK